jgi:hypothetical protein
VFPFLARKWTSLGGPRWFNHGNWRNRNWEFGNFFWLWESLRLGQWFRGRKGLFARVLRTMGSSFGITLVGLGEFLVLLMVVPESFLSLPNDLSRVSVFDLDCFVGHLILPISEVN